MPRKTELRYWQERGVYYCQLNGKKHFFGPEQAEAGRQFHLLMAGREPPQAADDTVLAVFDAFLDWTQQHRSPRTYDFYRERLEKLARVLPKGLRCSALKPRHVTEWFADKGWSDAYRAGCVTAVKRGFNWAVREGLLDRSPVGGLVKPESAGRDNLMTAEEYQAILAATPEGPFRNYLVVGFETGARPQEIRAVERRHVVAESRTWQFPARESKGRKHPRTVVLTPQAFELTQAAMAKNPSGPIFRNEDGQPWTRYALNCGFSRVQYRMGCPKLESGLSRPERQRAARKQARKYAAYDLRHAFAHRLLTAGVDPMMVATLMGHRNLTMVHKVYGHWIKATDQLRNALAFAAARQA